MENYIFRPMRPEELPEMLALVHERILWMDAMGLHQWNETDYESVYPASYYRSRLNSLYVLVREDTGAVAAAGALFENDPRWESAANAFYLHHLAAKTGEKGAGGRFLDAAEKYAKNCGKESMRLDSAEGNEGLTAFYTKHGYMPVGTCIDGAYRGILREKYL